jgi:CheY-like chemotaxis protein
MRERFRRTGASSRRTSRRAPRAHANERHAIATPVETRWRPPILVVDDDSANLKLAQALLEAEGFEVLTATDAISTLEVLKTREPALILMDIQLPGMDGWELTRRLKANAATGHIPVIALTAYGHSTDLARARDTGFVEYIAKPVSTRELPKIVRRHIAQR